MIPCGVFEVGTGFWAQGVSLSDVFEGVVKLAERRIGLDKDCVVAAGGRAGELVVHPSRPVILLQNQAGSLIEVAFISVAESKRHLGCNCVWGFCGGRFSFSAGGHLEKW